MHHARASIDLGARGFQQTKQCLMMTYLYLIPVVAHAAIGDLSHRPSCVPPPFSIRLNDDDVKVEGSYRIQKKGRLGLLYTNYIIILHSIPHTTLHNPHINQNNQQCPLPLLTEKVTVSPVCPLLFSFLRLSSEAD
jgi:hypothetical protein